MTSVRSVLMYTSLRLLKANIHTIDRVNWPRVVTGKAANNKRNKLNVASTISRALSFINKHTFAIIVQSKSDDKQSV